MPGQLTPLLLTAMNGLLDNQSIEINAEFTSNIAEYRLKPLVSTYRSVAASSLDSDIIADIYSAFGGRLYLLDANEESDTCNSSPYLTDYLLAWANQILASAHTHKHAKFIQTFQVAMSYVSQMNNVINSAVNGSDVASSSFTSMDELSTGNITAISSNTVSFGNDLEKIQKYIDFSELKYYGTPYALLLALIRLNAIGLLVEEFQSAGINVDKLTTAVSTSSIPLAPAVQKQIYNIALSITGTKLTNILLIMNVSTEGIDTLADLIDTKKLFPSSISTLTAMDGNALELIFSGNNISAYTSSLRSPQENIIPPDIAKANLAFRNSLYQIKNIAGTQTLDLAQQAKEIELNTGLDIIESFETSVPADVSTGITNHLASGQSTDDTFYLTDGVGTPCGTTHTESIIDFNTYHDSLNPVTVGLINDKMNQLVSEYSAILADEPPGSAGDPTWDAWDVDRVAYINTDSKIITDEIAVLVESMVAETIIDETIPGNAYLASHLQVSTEVFVLTEAIDYPVSLGGLCTALSNEVSLPAAKKTIISFSETLHSLAEKTDLHDAVEVLEKLSIDNQGGQAIVASLREGRNLNKLDKIGVKTDTKINNQPKTVDPGELKQSNPNI